MHLHFRNVNDGFTYLVRSIDLNALPGKVTRRPSRYGDTLTVEEPVLVTYSNPLERVLFNEARDANPFLHLYEALWMLAGRNDVAPLTYYAKRMATFSDDGETLNGAYGYRWRHSAQTGDVALLKGGYDLIDPVDQLDVLVAHLKASPTSRRAVLQMWNVEDDLLKIDTSKDVCCNLDVMFSLRNCFGCDARAVVPESCFRCGGKQQLLDMTVTNRSNDAIWGMLGANYVHFGFLQEYMAAHLGAEVGLYHHFTNNMHVYTNNWKPAEWLAWSGPDYYSGRTGDTFHPDLGEGKGHDWKLVPLVQDPATFEQELPRFVDAYGTDEPRGLVLEFKEPFLATVAQPMLEAFRAYKLKGAGVMSWAAKIAAADWRAAAESWLRRRLEKRSRSVDEVNCYGGNV